MKYLFFAFVLCSAVSHAQSWETEVTQAPACYNSTEVIEDAAGNYAVAGVHGIAMGNSPFFLVKLTQDGVYTSHQTYHGVLTATHSCHGLIEYPGGGYLLYGSKAVDGAAQYDYFLIRVNASGDTLWTRAFGSATAWEALQSGLLHNGCLYFVAYSTDTACVTTGTGTMRLLKLDTAGNVLWDKCHHYGAYGGDGTFAEKLTLSEDSSLLVAGTVHNDSVAVYGPFPFLMKLDLNGDTIFYRTFFDGAGGKGLSVASDRYNCYYLVGVTSDSLDIHQGFIVKIDSVGTITWSKTVGTIGDDNFQDITINDKNQVYVCGGHYHAGNIAMLIRFDLNGNILWDRAIDRVTPLYNLSGTADYGVVAAARDPVNCNAYVVKIDSAGNVPLGYIEPYTTIKSITRECNFEVFPNPTGGEVTVCLKDALALRHGIDLVVSDVLGRVVLTQSMHSPQPQLKMSLAGFSDGCYILNITDNGLPKGSAMIMLKR